MGWGEGSVLDRPVGRSAPCGRGGAARAEGGAASRKHSTLRCGEYLERRHCHVMGLVPGNGGS